MVRFESRIEERKNVYEEPEQIQEISVNANES